MTDVPFIPVCEPDLSGNEKKYVLDCLESGWISSEGSFVADFEKSVASRVNRSFGVAVANGSAALEIAVKALGLGVGDEIIVPTFTIISCVNAIVKCGATPVLVDMDPVTLTMDVNQVKARITPRTKAIMVVHIYGLPADMDPLLEIARDGDLKIIEDAAEMMGQTYKGEPCGSFGDVSIFSFYSNKFVTTGEGGMLVTDNEDIADACRSLRNLCFQPGRRFHHEDIGWNYRMGNIQAAIGVAQMERLEDTVSTKRRIAETYNRLFQGCAGIELPPQSCSYSESIYWVYGVVLDDTIEFDAEELLGQLAKLSIGTRPYFWPMHEQPVFLEMGLFAGEGYSVSERLARRGLYIPNGLNITGEQQSYVADTIKRLIKRDT